MSQSGAMALTQMIESLKQRMSLDGHPWIVFQGDLGGQIYATVPLSILPEDLTMGELHALLNDLDTTAWSCNEGDGKDVNVSILDEIDPAVTDFTPRLAGWRLIGQVSGGMGGGLILEDEMWFHDEFMRKGLAEVNRLRALLRLAPISSFEIVGSFEKNMSWLDEDDEDLDD